MLGFSSNDLIEYALSIIVIMQPDHLDILQTGFYELSDQ